MSATTEPNTSSTVTSAIKEKDEELIPVKVPRELDAGAFEAHGLIEDTVYYHLDDLKEQWNALVGKISNVVSSRAGFGDYKIDEITVKIGFNAKGKLVFVAEAGVDVAFEVVFKRP